MSKKKSVLIIKLGDIGDVALALGLIKAFESESITWVVGNKAKPLLELTCQINQIITVNENALVRGSIVKKTWQLLRLWKRLAFKYYDTIVTAHKDTRYRLISLWTLRKHHFFFSPLDTFPLGATFHGHAYLDLVKANCQLEYPSLPLTCKLPRALHGITPPWVVLNIFGNPYENKQLRYWDTQYYKQLAQLLIKKNRVVIIGDANALPYSQEFEDIGCVNLVGSTTLEELISLLKASYCLVTHDSGPLHLARLVRCNIVALFGPTDPCQFTLKSSNELVITSNTRCSPCYDGKKFPSCMQNICLKTISAELVYAQMMQRFPEIL